MTDIWSSHFSQYDLGQTICTLFNPKKGDEASAQIAAINNLTLPGGNRLQEMKYNNKTYNNKTYNNKTIMYNRSRGFIVLKSRFLFCLKIYLSQDVLLLQPIMILFPQTLRHPLHSSLQPQQQTLFKLWTHFLFTSLCCMRFDEFVTEA